MHQWIHKLRDLNAICLMKSWSSQSLGESWRLAPPFGSDEPQRWLPANFVGGYRSPFGFGLVGGLVSTPSSGLFLWRFNTRSRQDLITGAPFPGWIPEFVWQPPFSLGPQTLFSFLGNFVGLWHLFTCSWNLGPGATLAPHQSFPTSPPTNKLVPRNESSALRAPHVSLHQSLPTSPPTNKLVPRNLGAPRRRRKPIFRIFPL